MTPTGSPALHSRRERSSLQPSPPQDEWRRRRKGPDHLAQPRQQRRRGVNLPWPFTPRAESAISFGGPVAEERSDLHCTFGMANDEEPVEKALMASSSIVVTSEGSVNSNLATLRVDGGASSHYLDDAITRDLKHRLQDYVHLATPRKILTAGGALLNSTAEGMLQGLVTDDNGNEVLVRVDIVVVPGIGRNLFSVMTATKKALQSSSTAKTPDWRDSTSPCLFGARAATSILPNWT